MSHFFVELQSEKDFETLTKNSTVCVVDFHAVWCGPCKKLAPVLEKKITDDATLSKFVSSDLNNLDKKIVFVKVNVDNFPSLSEKHNVSSIPQINFYKDGTLQKNKVIGANLDAIVGNVKTLSDDLTNPVLPTHEEQQVTTSNETK